MPAEFLGEAMQRTAKSYRMPDESRLKKEYCCVSEM